MGRRESADWTGTLTLRLGHLDLAEIGLAEMGPDLAGPARSEFARPVDQSGGASLKSVVLFVHCFADVVGGESGEDQSLDGAGEQAQEHGRQRHDQGH